MNKHSLSYSQINKIDKAAEVKKEILQEVMQDEAVAEEEAALIE